MLSAIWRWTCDSRTAALESRLFLMLEAAVAPDRIQAGNCAQHRQFRPSEINIGIFGREEFFSP